MKVVASRAQATVLVALLVMYASLYLCRANLAAAQPRLQADLEISNTEMGVVLTSATAVYALGKLVLGALCDRVGGKRIILIAMCGSVVATFAFGFSSGIVALGVLASVNRFFQAGGWGGLVRIVSRWFPARRHGIVMGVLSTGYEVGNFLAILFCGALLDDLGLGWRTVFRANPAILAIVTLAIVFVLREQPRPGEVEGVVEAAPVAPRSGPVAPDDTKLGAILIMLARKPAFWIIALLSIMLTFLRTAFLDWTTTFLTHLAASSGGAHAVKGSIAKSAIFPAAGIIAAPTAGIVSDKLGPGRRAPVAAVSLVFLVGATLVLARGTVSDPLIAAAMIGVCGLFLLGPYSLLGGAGALDVGGTRGPATAAGIFDGVGYLGASLSGVVIGATTDRLGWAGAFNVIVGVSVVATLVAIAWSAAGLVRARIAGSAR